VENVLKYEVKMKASSVRSEEIASQHAIFDEQVLMSMAILEASGVPWNGQVPVLEVFSSLLTF